VSEGDTVERGQTLVILEAMKMELRVTAPEAGRVKRLLVQMGDVVERGQALVEIGE
jgi:methylmalonyl-CoA carboxyltransferase 1.3S subunit